MKVSQFRLSNLVSVFGKYLKKDKVLDAIITVVFYALLVYGFGYQIGKLVSHILH